MGQCWPRVRYPEAGTWPVRVLAPTCHQIPFPLNHTSVFITISIHLYFFLSVSHHTSLFFSLFFFHVFFPWFFPLFYFTLFFPAVFFSQFFPSVSHPSSHPLTPVSTAPSSPIPIYPRSCVVCFGWRSALTVKLFVPKTTKVSVESCGKLSNPVEHYFTWRTATLGTTLCRNLIQASNLRDSFDQLFLWIFNAIFTQDAPQLVLYHGIKKSKWPKTQIKGSCL